MIDRKDRDRQGGHKCSLLADQFGFAATSPVERKFMKREGTKKLRRQYQRITAQAIWEYEEGIRLDRGEALANQVPNAEWWDEEEFDEEGSLDNYYDHSDPYEFLSYDPDAYWEDCFRAIDKAEVGMSLTELLKSRSIHV